MWRALLAPRPRDAHKWQSAVAVVAGSPGMTGAAGLCARAAYRAGAGMVRLGIPGGDLADLPAERGRRRRPCPRRAGPPTRWPWRSGAGPSWSGPGSVGPTPPSREVRGLVGRGAGAGRGRRRRPLRAGHGRSPRSAPTRFGRSDAGSGAGRAHPPRRGVRPAWRERPRAPTGSPRPARWRSAYRRRGPAQGADHRRGRPDRDGAAGHGGVAPPGHGRDRRRPVGGHRRLRRPGRRPAPRRRPGRPRPRPGRRARLSPRASWPATWPTSSADGCRASGDEPVRRPRRAGRHRRRSRSRPVWAEIDLGAVRHNAVPARRGGRAGRPVRGGEGRRLRPRGRAPWPGPPSRAGPPGWRWRRPRRASHLRAGRHRRPRARPVRATCPRPWPTSWATGSRLALYTRRVAWPAAARGLDGAPVWSPMSTSRWTPACTGSVPTPPSSSRWSRPWWREPSLRFAALWTHFPVADGVDDEDRSFTEAQLRRLDEARDVLAARRASRPRCSTPPTRPAPSPTRRPASTWSGAASPCTGSRPSRGRRRRRPGHGGHRRRGPASRAVAAGQGDPRAPPRRRRAPVLRPPLRPAACARRWPPCPSATPTACPGATSPRAVPSSSVAGAAPWPGW